MNAQRVSLAIAPIGWTNDDMPELGGEHTFEQIVSEMALAGFRGSEVGSKYPRDPARLKRALELRGLQICNAWFSTFFANGEREQTLAAFIEQRDFLHAMGAKVIGCSEQSGSIQGKKVPIFGDQKPCFSEQAWQRVAEGYNTLARLAAEKGMQVGLHHHMGTGIQSAQEIDTFLSRVDDDVFLLFDTGHAWYAEGSESGMLAILQKHLPRIKHVHLKDVRPAVIEAVRRHGYSFLEGVKMGTFTVPGDGAIDFRPVFRLLDEADYQGWLVVEAEQDPARANPLEYALKARRYLRDTAGL